MGLQTWVYWQMGTRGPGAGLGRYRHWGVQTVGQEKSALLCVPVSGFQFYLWKISWTPSPRLGFYGYCSPGPTSYAYGIIKLFQWDGALGPHTGYDVLKLGNGWICLLRAVIWGGCSLALPSLAHSPSVLGPPPNLLPPPQPSSRFRSF